MVPIFVAVGCALISFVIAALAIGREARRLDSFSPVPVYDVEQAVAFVADRLPEDMSSRLSFWDVRKILDWSRSDQEQFGLSSESLVVHGPNQVVEELVVVSDDRQERLLNRAIDEGTDFSGADLKAVLEAELLYLESIGAVGPPADAAT
jgi:hypothetical protein